MTKESRPLATQAQDSWEVAGEAALAFYLSREWRDLDRQDSSGWAATSDVYFDVHDDLQCRDSARNARRNAGGTGTR
ncbi:MAG: hypothetical protein ACM3N4_09150, partial [Nitrososphaerota archaeon]